MPVPNAPPWSEVPLIRPPRGGVVEDATRATDTDTGLVSPNPDDLPGMSRSDPTWDHSTSTGERPSGRVLHP